MNETGTLLRGAALREHLAAPRSALLEALVMRLGGGRHAVANSARLTREGGLVGDRWAQRPRLSTQLTLMDARVVRMLLAQRAATPGTVLALVPHEGLDLPGDNLVIDWPTSRDALPPGTRLGLGQALIEIIDTPHLGCAKFEQRFGPAALAWVNDEAHLDLRLRGIYAVVVEDGEVALSDRVDIRVPLRRQGGAGGGERLRSEQGVPTDG